MASEVVILSFGIFLIEDTLTYLMRKSVLFTRNLLKYSRKRNQPSLVRKIGSRLTWIKARRLHILWREGVFENPSLSVNSSLTFHSQFFDSHMDELKESVQLEIKVEELEKELFDLRVQVTKLLLVQESKIYSDEFEEEPLENVVTSSTGSAPLPPPPPPPLPPTPLVQNKTLIVRAKPKPVNPVVDIESTCGIMEELRRRPPKLRHVELSPGGRPVRSVPISVNPDPYDVLTAVLKKRYEAYHTPTHERCLLSQPVTPDSPQVFGH